MNPYQLRQLDDMGSVITEHEVDAYNCREAIRHVGEVFDGVKKIEVVNDQGETAGEFSAEYCRNSARKR